MNEEYYSVKEVMELTGLTRRTLHHYDEISLLTPSHKTSVGYRLYSAEDLKTLQLIMFYRELEFPLGTIKTLLTQDSSRLETLKHQEKLMEEKMQFLQNSLQLLKKTIHSEENKEDLDVQELFPGKQLLLHVKIKNNSQAWELMSMLNYADDSATSMGGGGTIGALDEKKNSPEEMLSLLQYLKPLDYRLADIPYGEVTQENLQNLVEEVLGSCEDITISIRQVIEKRRCTFILKDQQHQARCTKIFEADGTTLFEADDEQTREHEADITFQLWKKLQAEQEKHLPNLQLATMQTITSQYLPWSNPGDYFILREGTDHLFQSYNVALEA